MLNYLIINVMKKMKISLIASLLFLTAGILSAQEFKIPTTNSKEGRLVLKDFSGSLPIEGYNGTDIIITSTSEDLTPPAKAKGLKPLFPAGTDNTGIGLDVEKTDNAITMTCLLPFTRMENTSSWSLKTFRLKLQADASGIQIFPFRT